MADIDTADIRVMHEHLDYLDKLAIEGDMDSRAALSSTEITRLTSAWRAVLAAHHPDDHGRCPQCSGWWLPRKHPCTVWTIAHQHLIAADDSSPVGIAWRASPPDRQVVTVAGGPPVRGTSGDPHPVRFPRHHRVRRIP